MFNNTLLLLRSYTTETYIFADTVVSYGSGWVEDNVMSTRPQKIEVKI